METFTRPKSRTPQFEWSARTRSCWNGNGRGKLLDMMPGSGHTREGPGDRADGRCRQCLDRDRDHAVDDHGALAAARLMGNNDHTRVNDPYRTGTPSTLSSSISFDTGSQMTCSVKSPSKNLEIITSLDLPCPWSDQFCVRQSNLISYLTVHRTQLSTT